MSGTVPAQPEFALFRGTASTIRGLAQLHQQNTQTVFGTVQQQWLHFLDATESGNTPARRRPDDIPGCSDSARIVQTPATLLDQRQQHGSREATQRRLRAYWLRAENRHGQIDNDPFLPLRHQTALVEYLLRDQNARRLLIADEVGLGKTIEIGLLLRRMLRDTADLRVAYITRGGLVENVAKEFAQLGLTNFYLYANADVPGVGGSGFASIRHLLPDCRRFIISLHKLGHGDNWKNERRLLGETRFDVVIVDECHALRAYGSDDVNAQKWFRVIQELLTTHTTPDGRVYFLSGTPHQGNSDVFLNLAGLLLGMPNAATLEDKRSGLRNRVVFRIKEDIRDWEDRPLFPSRHVQPPVAADAPSNYQNLLDRIGDYFDAAAASAEDQSASALGFVKSQALQYAASSPKAGFAYLLRRYIRYFASRSSELRLLRWIEHVLPYRGTTATASELLAGWRSQAASDVEYEGQLPDDVGEAGGEEGSLRSILDSYEAVLRDPKASAKFEAVARIIETDDEPFVVFSQALETVHDLKRWFADRNLPVFLIVGGQSGEERAREIQAFRSGAGRRVLISSAAGTEGINLQVARQIVHFDLPWNPMVLEQRVGRVHRIGSVKTIQVHTILLRGSREEDIYRRLSDRLKEIVRDLHDDPSEREKLYRRILTGLDSGELRRVFAGDARPDSLGPLVRAGYDRVIEVDKLLRNARANLGPDERGRATMAHLTRLLLELHKMRDVGETIEYQTVEYDEEKQCLERASRKVTRLALPDAAGGLIFDRTAAAVLQQSRNETGGVGNPHVDQCLREMTRVADEDEYVSKSLAWVKLGSVEGLPEPPGYVLIYLTGEIATAESAGRGLLHNLRMRAFVLGNDAGSGPVELDGATLETLLWDAAWVPGGPGAQRADLGVRDSELRRQLLGEPMPSASDGVCRALWPLAAIGVRP